ncbi:hypothetical protein EVAR_34750_1 [Eumeta japonica]|uniref:Uncharacterized protein n=1 Tax=Eumeta variegata TaxID=151549 RepID=A0A4C1YJD6_EUMVA|nr:hypothetical protein EVAR_34750_1 [Eumeta japonica]
MRSRSRRKDQPRNLCGETINEFRSENEREGLFKVRDHLREPFNLRSRSCLTTITLKRERTRAAGGGSKRLPCPLIPQTFRRDPIVVIATQLAAKFNPVKIIRAYCTNNRTHQCDDYLLDLRLNVPSEAQSVR